MYVIGRCVCQRNSDAWRPREQGVLMIPHGVAAFNIMTQWMTQPTAQSGSTASVRLKRLIACVRPSRAA